MTTPPVIVQLRGAGVVDRSERGGATGGRRTSGVAAYVGDARWPMVICLLLSAFSWSPLGSAALYAQLQIGALVVAVLLATRRPSNERAGLLDARRLTLLLMPLAALSLTPWSIALEHMDLTWVLWGKWIALSAWTAAAGVWLSGLTAPRSHLRIEVRAWALAAQLALAIWFGSLLQGIGEVYSASGQTRVEVVQGILMFGLALRLLGRPTHGPGAFRTRLVASQALNNSIRAVADGLVGEVKLSDERIRTVYKELLAYTPPLQRWYFEASARAVASRRPWRARRELNFVLRPALLESLRRADGSVPIRGAELKRTIEWVREHTLSWAIQPWSGGRGERAVQIEIAGRWASLRTESGIAPAHLVLEMPLGKQTQAVAPDLRIRSRAAAGGGGVRTGDPVLDQLLRLDGVTADLAEGLTRDLHQPLLGAINEHPCSEIYRQRASLMLPAATLAHSSKGQSALREGLCTLVALVDGLEMRAKELKRP